VEPTCTLFLVSSTLVEFFTLILALHFWLCISANNVSLAVNTSDNAITQFYFTNSSFHHSKFVAADCPVTIKATDGYSFACNTSFTFVHSTSEMVINDLIFQGNVPQSANSTFSPESLASVCTSSSTNAALYAGIAIGVAGFVGILSLIISVVVQKRRRNNPQMYQGIN
jgi:hypothetical protein